MIHALERAKERYGLELTGLDLRRMVERIEAGDSVLLGRMGDNRERHLLDYGGMALIVVRCGDWIITVLPRNHRKHRAIRSRKCSRSASF